MIDIGRARLSSLFTWKGCWCLDLGASRRQMVDGLRSGNDEIRASCRIRTRFARVMPKNIPCDLGLSNGSYK